MVEKRFEKLGMPDIERFENYLPTAFNSELTLLQKVNKIIFDLIETNKLTNEMVEYLNRFIESFDEKLYETLEDVLNVWLEDGRLADIVRVAISEEVIEARTDYLGKKYANLKERLDSEKANIVEVTTQLAQKAEQEELLRVLQQTDPNKNYKFVAAVIRNNGWGWVQIDGNHQPLNVADITQDELSIFVNYDFVAKNVVSFVATPDESMARDGCFMGASVGLDRATIQLAQLRELSALMVWNGTSWTVTNYGYGASGDYSFDFTGGILTITHPLISNTGFSITPRADGYKASLSGLTPTTTKISFYDDAGALVTALDPKCKFYFNRGGLTRLGPADYVNQVGNIWCFGIMEVE